MAKYIISKEPWIQRTFKYTYCCDEVFLQTLIINSSFEDKLYHKDFDNDMHAIMRLIDWSRGKPYTFQSSDYRELIKSDLLFARKFDASTDRNIIQQISDFVLKQQQE